MQIHENLPLIDCNTLRLASTARYFSHVDSLAALQEALAFAREQRLGLLVLGGGSNVVLGRTIENFVLRMELAGETVISESDDDVVVRVAAGEAWHPFVVRCHARGWYGLENLALIPGTVGAAPIQNIGAYGVELEEFFVELSGLDRSSSESLVLGKRDCEFAYRDSVFKHCFAERLVIDSVTLRLSKRANPRWHYPALRAELERQGEGREAADVLNAVMRIRAQRLPDPAVLPNVGSFFKNPIVSTDHYATLHARHPGIVQWPSAHGVKLAAAWLVDQAGWRGVRLGGVGVHDRQALVLVNHGGASTDDVLRLAARIRDSVQQRFGVDLEIEPSVYR